MRLPDKLKVEIVKSADNQGIEEIVGVLDNFTSFVITNDITLPSEAAFELGDNSTWETISRSVSPGTDYKVFINDNLRLTGKVEMADVPIDASAGGVVRFTVRTKLSDAQYASANPSIKVKGVSLKDFILGIYEPLGYIESDFIGLDATTNPATARDLITGIDTTNKGSPKKTELEPIKVDQARVNPPETIFMAADRHLRRHGLMHWDSPDGKIVISSPNDTQDPIYFLRANRGEEGRENNILRATRVMDYSGIPSQVAVFGSQGKVGNVRTRVAGFDNDFDVQAAGFYRPVLIIAQGVRSLDLVDRAAKREMSARRKNKDAWEIEIDGLSWWNGQVSIPFGVDTVAELTSNVAGGATGAYYIHRVVSRRDAMSGDITNISATKRGIWVL